MRKLQSADLQNFDETTTAVNEEKKNSFTATATNPFKNKIDVQLMSADAGKAILYLSDVNGRIIIKKEIQIIPGNNLIPLSVSLELTNGVYILRIEKDDKVKTINLVKK